MSKKTYHHLTQEERWQIKALLASGMSCRGAARALGRSASTIAAEAKRGALPCGSYSAKRGQNLYLRGRRASGRTRRTLVGNRWKQVRRCLLMRWSPEQTAGRLRREHGICLSHSTIYRRIWREAEPSLLRCLRYRGKRYRRRGVAGRHLIPNRVDIRKRPGVVALKKRRGDWEADTIVGAGHKGAILSLVDRASKLTCLAPLPDKRADAAAKAIVAALKALKRTVHTITYDNGAEFAAHQKVNRRLKCRSFFATPYHSWERGLNEHTNGLVRQFYPKGQTLTNLCPQRLNAVESLLNNRPRKALNFKTPNEAFFNTPLYNLIR
jgi:IS30 family transposase